MGGSEGEKCSAPRCRMNRDSVAIMHQCRPHRARVRTKKCSDPLDAIRYGPGQQTAPDRRACSFPFPGYDKDSSVSQVARGYGERCVLGFTDSVIKTAVLKIGRGKSVSIAQIAYSGCVTSGTGSFRLSDSSRGYVQILIDSFIDLTTLRK